MEFSSERFEIKIAMFFLRDHFSLKNAGEKEEYTALYIRAPRIDGRFSTLHKVEEEIDARFNSGSKMEFLSGRFEIKIRMFLKINPRRVIRI